MERKEMKKRAKGMLALLLAFIMMFGTSLTVFAAETTYYLLCGNGTASPGLEGTTVNAGDTIALYGSGYLEVVINGRTEYDRSPDTASDGYHSYTLQSGPYRASFSSSRTAQGIYFFTVTLTTPGSGSATNNTDSKSKKKDSTGTTNTHIHSYSWVTV